MPIGLSVRAVRNARRRSVLIQAFALTTIGGAIIAEGSSVPAVKTASYVVFCGLFILGIIQNVKIFASWRKRCYRIDFSSFLLRLRSVRKASERATYKKVAIMFAICFIARAILY